MVLPDSVLCDLPALDHPFDTYSLRCWRTRLWACFLAQPVLLLLLLLDDQVSNTRQVESTMGLGPDHRDGTVGVDPRAVNMEYEQIRGGCEQ